MKNYNKASDYTITIPWTTEGFPGLNTKQLKTKRKVRICFLERGIVFTLHKKRTKIKANQTFYYPYKT